MFRKFLLPALVMAGSFLATVGFANSLTGWDPATPAPEQLANTISNLVISAGTAISAWYFITAAAALVAATLRMLGAAPLRLERSVRRFGAPVLRRVVLLTTASSLAFASPAFAAPLAEDTDAAVAITADDSASRNSAFLVDLGWVVTEPPAPAEASTPLVAATPAAAPLTAATPSNEERDHVVRPGDTLWGIAAADLQRTGSGTSTWQVAEHWPRWYAENRDLIGADPNLIIPGTILRAPTLETP